MVLAPTTQFTCSYPGDGGTADSRMCCGGCAPGQSFAPDNLQSMMELFQRDYKRGNYNEVVVSSQHWMDHLPGIIQAFISGRGHNNIAHGAHAAFLATYGLTAAQVPMVAL